MRATGLGKKGIKAEIVDVKRVDDIVLSCKNMKECQ